MVNGTLFVVLAELKNYIKRKKEKSRTLNESGVFFCRRNEFETCSLQVLRISRNNKDTEEGLILFVSTTNQFRSFCVEVKARNFKEKILC